MKRHGEVEATATIRLGALRRRRRGWLLRCAAGSFEVSKGLLPVPREGRTTAGKEVGFGAVRETELV